MDSNNRRGVKEELKSIMLRSLGSAFKGIAIIVGFLSTIAWISGLVYLLRRLRTITSDYKFGPARKLGYLSGIVHRTNRIIDEAAIEEWRDAMFEDARHYDSLEENHDLLFKESKRTGKWDRDIENVRNE